MPVRRAFERRVGTDKAYSAIVLHEIGGGAEISFNDNYSLNYIKNSMDDYLIYGKLHFPLYFDEMEKEKFGNLTFYYNRWQGVEYSLLFSLFLCVVLSVAFYRYLNLYKKNHTMQLMYERSSAVAKTTQMLAHDVRKPFSMIKALVSMMLESDIHEARKIAEDGIPSIIASIRFVEGMIQDVMEVGNESNLNTESINGRKFIFDNLTTIFQFRENISIQIETFISKNIFFQIDILKFSRVIQNIINNAVEHMGGDGKIWIVVASPKNGYSKFTIGNSDTFISPEDRKNLFNAFFTKGKKGGTGLGLAIVQKVVESHGGSIHCDSSKESGTEFIFTVPSQLSTAEIEGVSIPTSTEYFQSKTTIFDKSTEFSPGLVDLETLKKIRHLDFSTSILDDETIYVNAIKTISSTLNLKNNVSFYSKSNEMLEKINLNADLIILDVDLQEPALNGFDVCRKLRNKGYKGKICIHSNRGRLEFQPKAIDAGADFFLPKPMSKNDLVMLLSQCVDLEKAETPSVKALLFEDEGIYQRQWKRLYGPGELEIHDSLTSFDISLATGYDYAICDYYLKKGETGIEVAKKLREAGFSKPIFLNSNVDSLPEDEAGLFDLIVKKDAKEAFEQISKHLKDIRS
ncbi:MAG: response regulator [Pseudobacteriovorax sp.]|nr:response regulator [Pseudobacteriovorax sp.]